jgi:hypothetical protein
MQETASATDTASERAARKMSLYVKCRGLAWSAESAEVKEEVEAIYTKVEEGKSEDEAEEINVDDLEQCQT